MQRRRERDEDDQLHATEHQDAGEYAERDVAERLVALAGDAVSDVAPEGDEHQVDQSEGHLHVGVAEDDGRGDVAVGVEDAFLHVAQHVPADDVHQVGELQDADRHGGGQHHDQQLGQKRVLLVPRVRFGLEALPVGFHRVGEALEDVLRAQLARVEDEQLLNLDALVLVCSDDVDVVGRQVLQRDLVVVQAGVLCRVDFFQLELAVLCRRAGELLEHELPKLVGADHEVVQGDGCASRECLQVDRGRLGSEVGTVVPDVLRDAADEQVVDRVVDGDPHGALLDQVVQLDRALAVERALADMDRAVGWEGEGLQPATDVLLRQRGDDLLGVEADAVEDENRVLRQARQVDGCVVVLRFDELVELAVACTEVAATGHSVAPFSAVKPGWVKQDG